jgi:hypothetical protein
MPYVLLTQAGMVHWRDCLTRKIDLYSIDACIDRASAYVSTLFMQFKGEENQYICSWVASMVEEERVRRSTFACGANMPFQSDVHATGAIIAGKPQFPINGDGCCSSGCAQFR